MILSKLNKRYINPVLIIILLVVLSGTITGCEYFEELIPPPPEDGRSTVVEAHRPAVKTTDRAILTVYQHLLSKAGGYRAKAYLASFYTASDNWSAELDVFKDGTSVWHIVVDMTSVEVWEEESYWQQASWFILSDGKVMPSNRLNTNALRIEADLQKLSLPPQLKPQLK